MTANNGATDFYLNIAELQLRDVVGGASVAVGGVAFASSAYSGNPASAAFDGSATTFYSSASGVGLPITIGYELPTASEIVQYSIQAADTAARLTRAPQAWTLECSTDGVTWLKAHTVTGQVSWGSNETRVFTI